MKDFLRDAEQAVEHAGKWTPRGWLPDGDLVRGLAVEREAMIEAYRAYLESLYDAVAELYEEGMSDFEMKDAVHSRLGPYHQWAGYETELGRHISLAYLQVEAAAF